MNTLWSRLRDRLGWGRVRDGAPVLAPPAGVSPATAGGAPLYAEADIVKDDLTIDTVQLASIAAHRAGLEYDRYVAAGMKVPPFVVLYDEEVARLRKTAEVMIECRTLRAQFLKLPLPEQAKRIRELEEYKRKYGLGGYR